MCSSLARAGLERSLGNCHIGCASDLLEDKLFTYVCKSTSILQVSSMNERVPSGHSRDLLASHRP
jgi:hypothetical protein